MSESLTLQQLKDLKQVAHLLGASSCDNVTGASQDINAQIDGSKIDVSGTSLNVVLGQKASTALATTAEKGLMSAQDKSNLNSNSIKLANIADNANRYVLPSLTNAHIDAGAAIDASKIDVSGTSLNVVLGQKASTAIASDQANGFMSKDDWSKLDSITVQDITDNKSKLAGIPANANYYVLPSNIPTDAVASDSADGLMSSGDKSKLDGIPANANYYVLPDNIPTNQIASTTQKGLMSAADKVKLEANTAKVGVSLADDPGGLTLVDDKLSAADTLASANTYTNTAISDIVDWSVTGTEDIHPDRYTNTTYSQATTSSHSGRLLPSGGDPNQVLKRHSSGGVYWGTDNDTNTTYSAGSGLELSGTAFKLPSSYKNVLDRISHSSYNTYNPTKTRKHISFDSTYRVGIGGVSPYAKAPLHVGQEAGTDVGTWASGYYIRASDRGGGAGTTSSSWFAYNVSIYAEASIFARTQYIVASDERIKTNIEDVPDHLALQQVRDLPCRYYEYKDKLLRGEGKTIGFIAQEVKEVLPMAVTIQKSVVPDHLKIAEVTWEEKDDAHYMTVSNINDDVVAGTIIRFICYNGTPPELNEDGSVKTPASEDFKEETHEVIMNDDGSFTMDKKYDDVFIYGKEVDDFMAIDKQKIFALHHSAIQELDRKVQEQEATIAALMERLAALEAKVQ